MCIVYFGAYPEKRVILPPTMRVSLRDYGQRRKFYCCFLLPSILFGRFSLRMMDRGREKSVSPVYVVEMDSDR